MYTVLDLLKATVNKQPDKTAIVFGPESMSFAAFDVLTDQLAIHLISLGLESGELVCVLLDRSPSFLVSVFGVLKAGGGYVPVDKEQGIERINVILKDSRARFIITSDKLARMHGLQLEAQVVYDHQFMTNPAALKNQLLPVPTPAQTAYVIYTSGTTGKPKGVVITHENLLTQVNAWHELCPVLDEDRTLLVAPFSFDASVYEIFTSIVWGSTLYLLEKNQITDVPFFTQTLIDQAITITYIPPLVIGFFAAYVSRHNINLPLRRLLVGVEPIRQKVLGQLKQQMPDGYIFNAYGPTEVTVAALAELFTGTKTDREIVSIGKALPGYSVLLLDDQHQLVPEGTPGEIAIAGKGLSPGYLHDTELTEKKFVYRVNPASPDERYYLTGDKAFILPDGNIEFIGRNDFQVKIKGFRVETAEIDAAFLAIPDVVKAVTLVNSLPDQQNELFSFYISVNEIPAIEQQLRARLPAYMLPVYTERLAEFPVTVAGKTDREALKQRYLSKLMTDRTIAVEIPETSTHQLALLFRKNLPPGDFATDHTYYQLGGDSIGAMVLIIDIQEKYGIHLSADWIYNQATFNALRERIEAEAANKSFFGDNDDHSQASVKKKAETLFPVTPAQKVLYFLHQLEDTRIVYNNFIRIDITGDFLFAALQKAFNYIVEQHDLMHASIYTSNAKLFWKIDEKNSFEIPYYTVNEFVDADNSFEDQISKWSRIPFVPEDAPLWRTYLVEMNEQHHVFFLNVHHLIFDGWSAGVFLNTLRKKYKEFSQKKDESSSDIVDAFSFNDFVRWQLQHIENKVWDADLVYWKKKFSALPKQLFDLPDKPRLAEGKRCLWEIPLPLIEEARRFSQKHQTTLFVVLFAPYFLTLFNKVKKWKGTIATIHANRSTTPFDRMIGYFINILAIQAEINHEMTLSAFIEQLNSSCQQAFQHSNYPFDLLLKQTGVQHTFDENHVFQCFFVFQNWRFSTLNEDFEQFDSQQLNNVAGAIAGDDFSFAGTTNFDLTELGSQAAKAVLSMNCSLTNDAMECWLEYPTNLFQENEINSLADDYMKYLATILEHTQTCFFDLVSMGLISNHQISNELTSFSYLPWPSLSIEQPSNDSIQLVEMQTSTPETLSQRSDYQQYDIVYMLALFLSRVFQTEQFALPLILPKNATEKNEQISLFFEIDHAQEVVHQWNVGVNAVEKQMETPVSPADFTTQNLSGDQHSDIALRSPVIIVMDGADVKELVDFPLIFYVNSSNASVRIRGFESAETNFFDSESLMNSFVSFSESLRKPGVILKDIVLLSHDKQAVLAEKCRSLMKLNFQTTEHVINMFARNVELFPEALSIIDGDLKWTYAQLDNVSSCIAGELMQHRQTDSRIVGIMLKRSPILIASVLGVLKAGMTYMPVDMSWPRERLNAIIENAKPQIILFQGTDLEHICEFDGLVIDPANTKSETYKGAVACKNNEAAYIIFTSGTTGAPKGVVVDHQALSSFTRAAVERYKLSRTDRVLQFASFTFDAAVEEMFCSLSAGACLVLRNEQILTSAEDFIAEIKSDKLTVLDLPTAFWSKMTLGLIDQQLSFPDHLRLVIIGGEKAPTNTVEKWKAYFANEPKLVNTYGPTETTVVVASCYLGECMQQSGFPLGYPLGDSLLVVVDDYLNPIPDGLVGQITVAGPQLAVGYLNDKEETERKFVPAGNLFPGNPILYLTGDKGLVNKKNQFEYRGRIDNQVKIRGFRVELAEIDQLALKFRDVREAYSKLSDFAGSQAIVSYLLVQNPEAFDKEAFILFLKKHLPHFMMPSAVVPMQSFPLSNNLKINASALPAPIFDVEKETTDAAMTPAQYLIAEIFSKVLELKHCRAGDNFFSLGGDSLQVLSCISEIKKQTALSLTIGVFYENPTVSALAKLLENTQPSGDNEMIRLPDEIVCLKRGNADKPPIFTVFLDAGNHHLPQLVSWNQPIYTFIPQGSDGERITRKSVGEMAACYLEIIINHFEKQPVTLIGYSFGGLVALEMAVLLRQKERQIEKLVLIDTYAPGVFGKLAKSSLGLGESFRLARRELKIWLMLALKRRLSARYRNSYIRIAWNRAAINYRFSPTGETIKLTVIKATTGEFDIPLSGWDKEAGIVVDCHLIEGNHHDLVRNELLFKQAMRVSGITAPEF